MPRPRSRLPESRNPQLTAAVSQEIVGAWARVQAPLCQLLLDAGVDFPRAAAELRRVFLEQARARLTRARLPDTDSALSLLSGVHRKEVRQWRETSAGAREQGSQSTRPQPIALSAQVFALWASLPGYHDRRHRPKPLPRSGPEPSFESLARRVTRDIHPFTLLQELARQGVVELSRRGDNEFIVPRSDGFVPDAELAQMLELLADNLSDHAATAVANVEGDGARLEQGVFADGLSEASMARLGQLARELWAQNRERMVLETLDCLRADADDPAALGRMRFGAYYWNTHDAAPAPSVSQAGGCDAAGAAERSRSGKPKEIS